VFFVPLTREFGWDRASTAGIFSLSILIFGLGSIFAGRMADRWGARWVVGLGGAFLSGGLLLSAGVQSLWQLYLCYGALMGLGVSAGWGPLSAAVSRSFQAGRGLAMGIMSIGISVGILIIPLLSSSLISAFGWRASFVILGVIAAVVMTGSTFLIKKDPRGAQPSGAEGTRAPALDSTSPPREWSLKQALVTRAFWMLFAGYLLWCTGFYMVSIHLAAYGTDMGLSPAAAAIAVSLIGGGSIFGKIFMGYLSDRIGPQKVLVVNLLLQGLCIFGLVSSRSVAPLYLLSALFGFGYGGTGPQIPVVTAKFFGLSSIGAIFGMLILSGQIGGAIGPVLAGTIFDHTKSYFHGFSVGGITILLAFLLVLLLKAPIQTSAGTRGPVCNFREPG
jgi:MFS family permease